MEREHFSEEEAKEVQNAGGKKLLVSQRSLFLSQRFRVFFLSVKEHKDLTNNQN